MVRGRESRSRGRLAPEGISDDPLLPRHFHLMVDRVHVADDRDLEPRIVRSAFHQHDLRLGAEARSQGVANGQLDHRARPGMKVRSLGLEVGAQGAIIGDGNRFPLQRAGGLVDGEALRGRGREATRAQKVPNCTARTVAMTRASTCRKIGAESRPRFIVRTSAANT